MKEVGNMRNDEFIDDSSSEKDEHPSLASSLPVVEELVDQMGSGGSTIQGTDLQHQYLDVHQ